MSFIHKDTHEEVTEGAIRARFSTRSFSDPITVSEALSVGYEAINEVVSGATEFQDAFKTPPVNINGQWHTGWTIADKSLADVAKVFELKIQKHLDDTAIARGYDNAISACSYAGAANPYQAFSQAFVAWRGAVWAQCYADLTAIQAGTKVLPTSVAAYVSTLPLFTG